ncbi:MAG: hypothetical protein JWO06_1477, partial [Bacteroidota bacterium]|nr:hypothetical protein [Bacteroidota bacterium]
MDYFRSKQIINYPKQRAFIDAPERYTVIEATTKAGKTTGCLVWLFEQALAGKDGDNFWWVAPVSSQALMVFKRLLRYIRDPNQYTANRSEHSVTLPNGATIYFRSADNADLLYGEDVSAVVIDEASRMSEDAWFAIRSTITKTRGRVKIIGNVKGTNNWAYQLARKAEEGKSKDWRYFKITADDAVEAGILDQEEIEDARKTLPSGVFLELYYGIPNQNSSNKFCFAFDETKHVGKCAVNINLPVYLSFDFNRNPICCSVIQYYSETIFVTHCIKLENSNIYNLCRVIRTKFPNATFIVTGDATGRAGSALTRDNMNYYQVIMQELNIGLNQMRVPNVNPSLEENQV